MKYYFMIQERNYKIKLSPFKKTLSISKYTFCKTII